MLNFAWLRQQPIFASAGVFFALTLLLTAPAYMIELRLIDGVNLWQKPMKFQLSLSIYFLSLAFFTRWAAPALLNSSRFKLYAKIVVAMSLAEIVWIAGAALFAVPSHYNQENIYMMAIYSLMGVFAITLTTASFVLGRSILRNNDTALDPSIRWLIGVSLIASCLLTIVVAGTLSSFSSHHIGTVQTGASLPIMGWSREVGDLRAAHFFALHAMHVLPVAALPILALAKGRARWTAAIAVTAIYLIFVLFLFVQALLGLPFIPIQ